MMWNSLRLICWWCYTLWGFVPLHHFLWVKMDFGSHSCGGMGCECMYVCINWNTLFFNMWFKNFFTWMLGACVFIIPTLTWPSYSDIAPNVPHICQVIYQCVQSPNTLTCSCIPYYYTAVYTQYGVMFEMVTSFHQLTQCGHSFQLTTFRKPTLCRVCKKPLWGVVHHGYQCSGNIAVRVYLGVTGN